MQQRSPHLQRRCIEGDGRQLQPHLSRPEVRVVRPQHQPRHRSVRHSHALRTARASRREHHVRQVVSTRSYRQVALRLASNDGPLSVHAHQQLATFGDLLRQLLLGDEDGDSRLALHPGQALQRVAGIERHIHATGLEDAEHTHHQLQRALHAQAHPHLRAHAHRPQMVRQLVGPPIEFRVRETRSLVRHRHRVRGPQHLRFEQLRQRRLSRVLRGLAAPPTHQLPAFRVVHQRQVQQSLLGPCHRGLQQHPQMTQQALHRRRVEEVAVVVHRRRHSPRHLPHQQRQVVLRRLLFRLHSRQRQSLPQLHFRRRRVLQRQRHLEQRAAAQVSLRLQLLHQLLEGHFLVRVRPQRRLPHLHQQLEEALVG